MGYKKRIDKTTDEITEINEESVPEVMPEPVPQEEPEIEPSQSGSPRSRAVLTEPSSSGTDEAARRKQEIADKRRASLALARTKIVPKSALKKQADEVIKGKDELLRNKQEETDAMKLKYERDRIRQLEDNLNALQKLIAEKPAPVVVAPIAPAVAVVSEAKAKYKRPSRSKEALESRAETKPSQTEQPQQIIPKKSVEPRMVARAAPPSTEKLIDKSYSEQLQERLRNQAVNKIMMDTFGGF
jgi:hypothetical protein